MSPEEAVRARIMTVAAVTAIVDSRVYMHKLPQSPVYPNVLVTLVTPEDTEYHLRGEVGLKKVRVQVDAYARGISGVDPYAMASTLAQAIHGDGEGSGLSGFSGDIGSPALRIFLITRLSRRPDYDPEELRVLRMSQDYQVIFRS